MSFAGAHLVQPAFPDDDGSCPPPLAAALAAHRDAPDRFAVVAALQGQRLLVPVVALLEASEQIDGHEVEKESAMATVTIRSATGAVALPVFSSTAALAAWDRQARPVAVPAHAAAQAALAEGADLMLLDPAGPVRVLLPTAAVVALAEGRRWWPPWEDPDVAAAVRSIATDCGLDPHQVTLTSDNDDLVIDAVWPPGNDAASLTHRLSSAMAADGVIRSRLHAGIQLRVTAS